MRVEELKVLKREVREEAVTMVLSDDQQTGALNEINKLRSQLHILPIPN